MELMLRDLGNRKARKKQIRKHSLRDIGFITLNAFKNTRIKVRNPWGGPGYEIYDHILDFVEQNTEDYDEEELKEAIHELSDFRGRDHEKRIIGFYTGSLLERLTKR